MKLDEKDVLTIIGLAVQIIGYAVTVAGAIYGSIKGAKAGAIEAYNRNKEVEREREQKQIQSVRLLLSLEVKQNLDDLIFLLNGIQEKFGERSEPHLSIAAAEQEKQQSAMFIARQRFIDAHYPKWGHHFWQGQQATYMLPIALEMVEIKELHFFHSQFDALSKIVETLSERVRQIDVLHDDPASELSERTLYLGEALILWKEFLGTTEEIDKIGNKLLTRLQGGPAASNEGLRVKLPEGKAVPQLEGLYVSGPAVNK